MAKKKVPVDHGFYVRLVTAGHGSPCGRLWFTAIRPGKRPPNLVRYLRHVSADPAVRVASITAATQTKRKEYDLR